MMSSNYIHEGSHEVDDVDDVDDEEVRTLFCANIDERVTEDLLYEVFVQAGPIESARIPKDNTGRQRTFGFITYVHKSTVPYALCLYNGLTLYRRTLTIKNQENKLASPIPNNNSPGFSSARFSYDNSPLMCGNYSPHVESPLRNPFRNSCTPDYHANSRKLEEVISKHASGQRKHLNVSPYERKSGGKEDRHIERQRDHNRRRQYNNGSNRHSDQRRRGKDRR